MDNAVALVQAYLQVNGYFTVTEYPVLEAARHGIETATDLDVLAFRFPGAGRLLPAKRGGHERWIAEVDPVLACPAERVDMLIGEVKEGRAELNRAARDADVLRAVLVRFGCCAEQHVAPIVDHLLRNGVADMPSGHRVRLAAFGSTVEPGGRGYHAIELGHVVEFLQQYLRAHWDVLRHAQFKHPAFGFLVTLEKARLGSSGGAALGVAALLASAVGRELQPDRLRMYLASLRDWRMNRSEACPVLWTGQRSCHDVDGREIAYDGSGQDAEFRAGAPWPEPRFKIDHNNIVLDRLTGLGWMRNANPAEYPMTWREALEYVAGLNRKKTHGCADWRLPNRRELRSLVSHQTRQPALPERHPFLNVFSGWYWTSTSAAISPAHAWYLHMEGARLFYGGKDQSFLAWPVRGAGNGDLPATGQILCYDETGEIIPCPGSGQDGEWRSGRIWPAPRFVAQGDSVSDRLTGLCWRRLAHLTRGTVTWAEALAAVAELSRDGAVTNKEGWRLPNINELESLVDGSAYSPALTPGHPFTEVRDVYWSSTTSMFEPDWAWALYLDKGAVGVGQKAHARFHAWGVCAANENEARTACI